MKRFIFLLIFALLFTGCTSKLVCEGWGQHLDFRDELSRVIILFGEEMRHKHGWTLEDSQVKYNRETHKIKLLFKSMDVVELCEARKLLVDAVDTFLERLNVEPDVVVDHGGYEFTYDDLEICVNFTSFLEQFVDAMYIGWMDLREGIASFYSTTFIAYQNPDDYWFKRREYFYQSRVIVSAQREAETLYKKPEETKSPEESYLEDDIFR